MYDVWFRDGLNTGNFKVPQNFDREKKKNQKLKIKFDGFHGKYPRIFLSDFLKQGLT